MHGQVWHAQEIRSKLLANWNLSNIPGRARQERLRLLHTVVVGGGPTVRCLWLRLLEAPTLQLKWHLASACQPQHCSGQCWCCMPHLMHVWTHVKTEVAWHWSYSQAPVSPAFQQDSGD